MPDESEDTRQGKTKLQLLVTHLAESACKLKWNREEPLKGARAAKTTALWNGFNILPQYLNQWYDLQAGDDTYPLYFKEVGERLNAVLRGSWPDHESPDGEFHAGRDGEVLTRSEALRLIHEIWQASETDREMLAVAQGLAREHHRQMLGLDEPPATRLSPELAASLPNDAQVLELPENVRETSVEARRNLFLRPPQWQFVCEGSFYERKSLHKKFVPTALEFLKNAPGTADAYQLPCFWIGGRSGDGKSILLMQLAHRLGTNNSVPPMVRFPDADTFIGWLSRNADQPYLAGPEIRLLAVIDDFHKLDDPYGASEDLARAFDHRPGVAVLTCGPNPERRLFRTEFDPGVAIKECEASPLGEADWEGIARHLGVELAEGDERSTLVERIFLSLPEQNVRTLGSFADSLKERVTGRGDRENLLEQLTLMTMLDLELPRRPVGEENAEWLQQLSSDTQLHIEDSDDGFKFGHRKIAGPIYDSLTGRKKEQEKLEHRIAATLLEVLPNYGSVMEIARVLRQVQPSLASRNDANSQLVFERLLDGARSPNIHQAALVTIMGTSAARQVAIDEKLKAVARTMRTDNRVDAKVQARVIRQLATAHEAEWADQRFALNALKNADHAPHLGRFVWWLEKKENDRILKHEGHKRVILNWVMKHPHDPNAQSMMGCYISRYPNDFEVRRAVSEYIGLVPPTELTSLFMASFAKHFESEMPEPIRQWLSFGGDRRGTVEVFAALLARDGSPWRPEAISYLGSLDKDTPEFVITLTRLLPFLGYDIGIQRDIDAQASRLMRQSNCYGFFKGLAECRFDYDVSQLLHRRIEYLDGLPADAAGRRELYGLMINAWSKMGGQFPQHARIVVEMMELLAGEGASVPPKARQSARAAVISILQSGAHAELYAAQAARFIDEPHSPLLQGMLAGSLLRADYSELPMHEDLEAVVSPRRERLREIAWSNLRNDEGTEPDAQEICSLALIRGMTEEDMPEIRAAVGSKWRTLAGLGQKTLSAWLRNEISRSDALEVLLADDSIDPRTTVRKGNIAARNQLILFEAYGSLDPRQGRSVLDLLRTGISNYKANKSAAWFALENRGSWPREAEKFIWPAILTAALEGNVISLDTFWDEFVDWQKGAQDPDCRAMMDRYGLPQKPLAELQSSG